MGSSTSGNFGHAGRKGEVGGSAPGVGDHVMFDLGNGAGREQGHVTEVHPSGQTMHVMNDKTKEIHHIESGQLRGNLRRASGSIWGKDANMRVNPGTKAPGIKAAAGERKVGNNMTEVTTPEGHRILKSYGTPVAMKALGGEPYQTEKKWSTTTTGHIRKWMGDTSNVKTKPQEFFDKAAARVGQDQFGTFRRR